MSPIGVRPVLRFGLTFVRQPATTSNCRAYELYLLDRRLGKVVGQNRHFFRKMSTQIDGTTVTSTTARERDREFGRALAILQSREARYKCKTTLLEGSNLIQLAMDHGITLTHLYYDCQRSLDGLNLEHLNRTGATLHHLEQRHYARAQKFGITSGVFGLCSIPDRKAAFNFNDLLDKSRHPIAVVCDNIRDPGNMVALITTTVATSCSHLIVTKGCVDVWDPKVLKDSAGCMFNIPVLTDAEWPILQPSIPIANCHILLADVGGNSSRYNHCIPLVAYDRLRYTSSEAVILVIGGETTGLSQSAYELCSTRKGCRVSIPMLKTVNSLNSAISASILLFEIHRQMSINV